MNFEFLIACQDDAETNMNQVLTESLVDALENASDYSYEDEVSDMIQFSHERRGDGFTLIGFTIELPETLSHGESIIDDFTIAIRDKAPESHVVKFEDPLLQAELAKWAAEIFALEMKLRRVLSIIYLNTYQGHEPFSLLRDETAKPMGKPRQEQMETATENQFFHLNFSEYSNLNRRPELKLTDILEAIRNAEQYDAFRAEIRRTPVEDEVDADLIADIKELIDPIENMRNCVAHNRRPTKRITESYPNALQTLDKRLDQYLANLSVSA